MEIIYSLIGKEVEASLDPEKLILKMRFPKGCKLEFFNVEKIEKISDDLWRAKTLRKSEDELHLDLSNSKTHFVRSLLDQIKSKI